MNLCFTYEFRDTLRSFTLFITVIAVAKLNLGHSNNLKNNFKQLAVVAHALQTTQNCSFDQFVFLQRAAKKCAKSYNARAQPLFCSLVLLFSDVPVAVAVVVILNSLLLSDGTSSFKIEFKISFD